MRRECQLALTSEINPPHKLKMSDVMYPGGSGTHGTSECRVQTFQGSVFSARECLLEYKIAFFDWFLLIVSRCSANTPF